jgi:hypothetical protein
MGQVAVFVDDAVRGTLPAVCAKDGVPTTDQMVVQDELGDRAGLGVAWLLLLLGPVGWLGLLIMFVSRGGRGEVLTVRVPMSGPAYERIRSARRLRWVALAVGVISGAMALWALASSGSGDNLAARAIGLMAASALIGSIIALFTADIRTRRATVEVDLDASRRWVTLSRVHPAFVAACQAQVQRQAQRT